MSFRNSVRNRELPTCCHTDARQPRLQDPDRPTSQHLVDLQNCRAARFHWHGKKNQMQSLSVTTRTTSKTIITVYYCNFCQLSSSFIHVHFHKCGSPRRVHRKVFSGLMSRCIIRCLVEQTKWKLPSSNNAI